MKLTQNNTLKTLGLKIQMLRKKNNLTQKDFAIQLGISRSYMGYIEQGRYYPSLKLLIKISEVLKIELSELLSTK
ncbi:MAG: helix-turn-helix transcriptional regulator [Candidatus Levybacteria bacterium]|nr:helix-turn-helix transcriptional regulator [Candidatus Levybacteria bacterium]MBP9815101.1 helix-turn-helix transcriptional regulator [Candidatus Levybacteria bacterium]